MLQFFSESSGSGEFDTDQGHSSSGSLPGIYSGTEKTELTTSTLRSSTYDPSKDLRKLSAASAGSDSMYASREQTQTQTRPMRSLRSRQKRHFGPLNPAQRKPNVPKPANTNIEMSSDSHEEMEPVRAPPPDFDAPPTAVPKDYSIVFLHNSSPYSLVLGEYSAGAGLDEESSSTARETSSGIPDHVDPGETIRFLLRGDIRYSFSGAPTRNGAQPYIRAWTQREDISEGMSFLKIECEGLCPDEVRLISNRGEQVSDFNPSLSIFVLSEQEYQSGGLPDEVFRDLIKHSDLDYWEIDCAWLRWSSMTGGGDIDKVKFAHFFPELDDPDVLGSIFHAFDRMNVEDATISFSEFIKGLSVMCRGSAEERALLAYDIFDLNNDGKVTRSEAIRLAKATARVLNAHGLRQADYGDPEKAVNAIFLKRAANLSYSQPRTPETARRKFIGRHDPFFVEEATADTKQRHMDAAAHEYYDEELPREFFIERSRHEPDILDAFGLFDFFHWRFLQEMESENARKLGIEAFGSMDGRLRMVKSSLPNLFKFWNRWATVEIRNGFLCWKRAFTKKGLKSKRWESAESLWDAKVRCVWPDRRRFEVFLGQKRRVFEAETEEEAHKWIVAIRSNRRRPNRFRSFSPVRDHTYARWFVNAEDYFQRLIDAIDAAKTRIYICAWAIAPQLYLRRTDPLDIEDRLDRVLLRTAQRGVQVMILFYDAPRVLHLESDWVHKVLNGLHDNIIAIRHPNSWSDMIWSHHQKSIIIDETVAFLGGIDLTYWRFDNRKYQILDVEEKTWPGKDYGNLYLHAEVNGPWTPGVIKREDEPRMPWHDISLQLVGWVAVDAAMNFIQRWNFTLQTGVAPRHTPPLMPLRVTQPVGRWPSAKTDKEFLTQNSKDGFEKIRLSRKDLGFDHLEGQVVRSASGWSSGVSVPERSIYKAYVDLITKSEHFIFIENQFFISSIDRGNPKNRIAEALFLRLCRAITEKKKFRVMVVIPMWPGGAITDGSVRFMTNYTYRTINRGGHSLLEKLQERFPAVDLTEYIVFFSLRQRGVSNDILHTEAIYIHAKMMVVDDKHAIVGSANINDRSLLGTRDSEIAVVVSAEDKDSVMNGQPYRVSTFVQSLRIGIMEDFIGLTTEDAAERLEDPVADEVFRDLILARARKNTSLYMDIFGVMPDNSYTMEQYRRVQVDLNAPENDGKRELLSEIEGVIVEFPLDFLKDEDLSIGFFEKEKYVPRVTFL